MKQKLKGVVTENSIVLHYGGEAITIQKETDNLLFEEFKSLLKAGDENTIIDRFVEVRERIKSYTNDTFYVSEGRLFLKGDDTPIPTQLGKKLLELEKSGEDFLPFILFWKKLKQNPSQASIEQLYGFIEHNNIPLTEFGDIVTEKGVTAKEGGSIGELVDCHSHLVDNSIGMEVSMDREDVDDDPNQTCSHGLHVGAPDYVRRWYSNNIIVKCIVNPKDVVSVPTDYDNTKMRVCRYVVVGYSDKTETKPVVSLSSFIENAPEDVLKQMEEASNVGYKVKGKDDKVVSKRIKLKADGRRYAKWKRNFDKMKAREVKEYVSKNYGINLPHSNKSKKAIVKRASIIAANTEEALK